MEIETVDTVNMYGLPITRKSVSRWKGECTGCIFDLDSVIALIFGHELYFLCLVQGCQFLFQLLLFQGLFVNVRKLA